MRLGVVLTGTGVYGAAGAGVLVELWRRKIEPYAVCGIGSGAWPAALFATGCDSAHMELAAKQATRMGKRLLRRTRGSVWGKSGALYTAEGLQHLLQIQTGGRILALCPRKALFPLRTQRAGSVVFASPGCVPGEGFAPVTQVSAAFAARAAMGQPPFLMPLEWMGARLLPMQDAGAAARMLLAAGAQRVLIVETHVPPQTKADPLLLTAACTGAQAEVSVPGAARLVVPIQERIGSLSFDGICACMELGRHTAQCELDFLFERMGMAHCRVLPFRRS